MIRSVRIRRRPVPPTTIDGLHPVLARVLAARGQHQAPDYSLKGLLRPTMKGLDAAADILAAAIRSGQRILVVGDFDADGATGTTLAVRALKALGARHVDWRVPDRFRHGYGLSPILVEEIGEPFPDVLVTVDQGVSSVDGVALAQSKGMKVVVTDHHLPGLRLPAADAIVNPNLAGEDFGSKALAGVGVAFYTAMAVRARLRDGGWFDRRPVPRLDGLLDLVALGTVADLVPLDENNRRLVYQGLARIRSGQCSPGVRALLEVAGRNLRRVKSSDMGFAAGPRLNAAGRLEDMGIGIRCLLTDSDREARMLADQLHELNSQRQAIQADMLKQADAQADRLAEQVDGQVKGLCVFDPDWHQGVVGLVAGRLMERLQRPVLAFAPSEAGSDELKGSGRSPAGVHMRDLLVEIDTAQPGLMERFGGHARAAGLSLDARHLERFQLAFDACLASHEFGTEEVETDGELQPDEFNQLTAEALEQGGPWGQGWPEPLFDGTFRVLERRVVGQTHLKLRLLPAGGTQSIDAIAFRAGRQMDGDLPEAIRLTYRLELNHWRGQSSPQINVQHFVSGLESV